MQKYLVKLMYNINIDNGNHTSQFDEQTRIIEAQTLEDAFYKARQLGKDNEELFLNDNGKLVHWKFIDVLDLYSLENRKDGEQLFSATHEDKDANSFIDYVKGKSMMVQACNLNFA